MANRRWNENVQNIEIDEPLTPEEVKALLCGFVAYPTVYKSALRVGFRPELLNGAQEQALFAFMTLFGRLFEAHGTVTKQMLLTDIVAALEAYSLPLQPADMEFLLGPEGEDQGGFIDRAFDGAATDAEAARAERNYVQEIVRKFLNARLVNAGLRNIVSQTANNASPQQLTSMLDQFHRQAQAIRFVGNEAVNAAVMPLPGENIILPPPANPTTISWVDDFIGGFRAADVIGLLGPYGGGKTTMLTTLAIRMARQYYANNENKLSVYICYEDGAEKMNWSFYSAAAHIHRSCFANKRTFQEFWDGLSTRENLKPYDRDLPINRNGELMLGEIERWNMAVEWLNKHFVFLDFSATAATNYRGNGGVQEIAATLENLRDSRQMEIGCVMADYAGPLINRFLAQDPYSRNSEQIWRPLQMLPDELKTHVGIPFSSTIILAHQLAQGDIKNIPSYRHVSHADAQGSKAFAENLHACLCLNKADPETHVNTINWSKIRFGRPESAVGLVQIDENCVDVRRVDDEYYINDIARKIMRRGEMAPMAHTSESSARPTRRIMPDIDSGFLS